MGAFNINITGVGGHGCDRSAKPGQKLHGRCGRFSCPDCAAYDFVQRLRQSGQLQDGQTATGQEFDVKSPIPEGAEVYHVDKDNRVVPIPVEGGKTYWQLKQHATFTHWPYSKNPVVDDMMSNERVSGSF